MSQAGRETEAKQEAGSAQAEGKALCQHVGSGSDRGTEASLKKESTGLGDRLTKAEGGPEMCLTGLEGLATLGTWRRLLASGAAGLLECLLFSVGRIAYI